MFAVQDLGVMRYQQAYQYQLETHAQVVAGGTPQLLLLEHPRVITHGRKDDEHTNLVTPLEVLAQLGIDVVQTERGGTATYHG
ncbi:MAG: lipoyl protein ligase domain-containing protein, partial [Deinococcales bacterium]